MNPKYRLYHPEWHRERMPIFWWLGKLPYIRFITRELTSLFIGYAALVLLAQIWALARGEQAYDRFLAWLEQPAVVLAHTFVLVALLYHAVTWLNLAPKALALRLGRRPVPDRAVLAGHYLAWLAAWALVAWLLLRSQP